MLTPEKRALVKFIVVAGARGPIRGGSKPDTFSTEDCQNSRSLCRFYSRSTRYEREIQPLPEDTPVSPPRFLSSLSLRSDELFEKLRARTTDNRRRPVAKGGVRPLKHMASKRARRRKTFTPRGAHVAFQRRGVPYRPLRVFGYPGRERWKMCTGLPPGTIYIEFSKGRLAVN